MSMLTICAMALISATLAATLKSAGSRLTVFLSSLAALLLAAAALRIFSPALEYMEQLSDSIPGECMSVILRVCAIAFVSSVGAGVCRDMGEGDIADKLILCARGEMLIVCLPLVQSTLETAFSLLR